MLTCWAQIIPGWMIFNTSECRLTHFSLEIFARFLYCFVEKLQKLQLQNFQALQGLGITQSVCIHRQIKTLYLQHATCSGMKN